MHKNKVTPLAMLLLTLVALIGGGGFADPSTKAFALPSSGLPSGESPVPPVVSEEVSLEPSSDPLEVEEVVEETTPENPWVDYENVCETFSAHQGEAHYSKRKGRKTTPVHYRRNRYAYTISDQRRTKEIIRLVAREMGVPEPDFFVAMAAHESSFHPEAIHILNEDLSANKKSWERHNYSAARETKLRESIAHASAQGGEFWKLKRTLSSLLTYKDNPHWNTRIEYDFVVPGRKLADGSITASQSIKSTRSVWALGYGLYGHNAVLWTKSWSREAPPWVLCSHQGIIATILEVWAARSAARECEELTSNNPAVYGREGSTYRGVLRRLATGKCSDRPLKRQWEHLFAEYGDSRGNRRGVPWDQKAAFGKKWPASSDRQEILAHMLKRAEEEGLLRPEPLQRKRDGSTPVMVARK